jgi:hypothetical protein
MTRLAVCAFLLLSHPTWAQDSNQAAHDSKFYVAVAVVVIILLGLIAYLFAVDRKISKFERKSKEPDQHLMPDVDRVQENQ